jgi:glycosyltransferase involved in cell wall biosynthesis
MELISVIVPVYKVEEYLDRCVRSIVEQVYTNLEIILVDDGSPDRCGDMCEQWAAKDQRITVVHKKNGGLSDARNFGLDVAQGEYVAFVDSDDWISPDYISRMYNALKKTGAEIAACDVCTVFPGEEVFDIHNEGILRECSAKEALEDLLQGKGFRAVAWNKLYRKHLLDGERYPVGKHHEDEFFTYRVLGKAEKLVYVEKPMYFYLQRQGSIMRTFSIKRLDALDAYIERLAYLKKRYTELYSKDKFTICVSCAVMYCQSLKLNDKSGIPIRRKIKSIRKQISITFKEYKKASMRQRVFAVGTGVCIGFFCKLISLRGENSGKVV